MKNPFEKNDNKVLIGGILLGSLASGALAYLFLTETGSQLRRELTGRLSSLRDSLVGSGQEDQHSGQTPDYLQHKGKAPKTDREKLKKNEITHQPGNEHAHHQSQQS